MSCLSVFLFTLYFLQLAPAWTAVGAPGQTTARAAPLAEEESREEQGSVTTQHLLVGGISVQGWQIKSSTATLSAVVFP